MNQAPDFFEGKEPTLIYIAKRLKDALKLEKILTDAGVEYGVEPDRRKAIALAISEARPGDIVLLAGKGHEKVQVTREGSHPFDDVEVARGALRAVGFECEPLQSKAGNAK